ncbi:MAG TPA: NfeD family protein [Blastocatellia bacterium]|nr:NfeD family protein [Blastocatellia bacterium]
MSNLLYLWLILGVLFIVAEIFTTGFVLLWFGVGALIAGLLAFLGLGPPFQVVAFLAVSIALTIASRTIFERVLMRGSPGRELKTGMESLPGRVGVVVTSSEGPLAEGAVRIFGSTWRAFPSKDEGPLREGERVQIDRVEGASVYVRKVDEEPSWRTRDAKDERE